MEEEAVVFILAEEKEASLLVSFAFIITSIV